MIFTKCTHIWGCMQETSSKEKKLKKIKQINQTQCILYKCTRRRVRSIMKCDSCVCVQLMVIVRQWRYFFFCSLFFHSLLIFCFVDVARAHFNSPRSHCTVLHLCVLIHSSKLSLEIAQHLYCQCIITKRVHLSIEPLFQKGDRSHAKKAYTQMERIEKQRRK